ncbi:MAG: methyl-accepting chemotaxis protein [Pyrinomonadaceae bacterium]
MNFSKLTVRKGLFLLSVTILVPVLILGVMSYRSTLQLSERLDRLATVEIVAAREMATVDMYHDSLRAVLYRAIFAAQRKDEDAKAEINTELSEYVQNLRSTFDTVEGLNLSRATKDAIKASRPDLEAYIAETEKLTSLATGGNLDQATAGIPKHQVAFESLEKKLDSLSDLVEAEGKQSIETGNETVWSAKLVLIAVLLINLVTLFLGFHFFYRSLGNRMRTIAARAEKLRSLCITNFQRGIEALATGDLDFNIVTGTEFLKSDIPDDLGEISRNLDGIIKQSQITIASFETSRQILRDLITEGNMLTAEANKGNIAERGDLEKYKGGFRALLNGMNETLDAIAGPLNEASACLQRAANRDLTAKMVGDYKGDFDVIKTSLNTALTNIDAGLHQIHSGAEQVASASAEISTGSQTLAQGTSEQASTLEEISSSLLEIASMTKQNTENSREARSMSDNAKTTTIQGMKSMSQLSSAVDKIKESSDSTAKIVKEIEEIAFQTNLLALNAAVEAARAGDAGKGFAVVAEEVRNLAMRSADAAKTTAQLIDESVKNTEAGVTFNAEVLANLEEINRQVEKVNIVVSEIAAASEQQSQGVEQITVAIEQMNGATQQAAANSEESASASEELSGQSQEMLALIGEFKLSASDVQVKRPTTTVRTITASRPAKVGANARKFQRTGNGNSNGNGNGHAKVKLSPNDIIPFDELDDTILSDF